MALTAPLAAPARLALSCRERVHVVDSRRSLQPLYAFVVSAMVCLSASATYHLIGTANLRWSRVLSNGDYLGIGTTTARNERAHARAVCKAFTLTLNGADIARTRLALEHAALAARPHDTPCILPSRLTPSHILPSHIVPSRILPSRVMPSRTMPCGGSRTHRGLLHPGSPLRLRRSARIHARWLHAWHCYLGLGCDPLFAHLVV